MPGNKVDKNVLLDDEILFHYWNNETTYQCMQQIHYGSSTPKKLKTHLSAIVGLGGGNYVAQGMTIRMPVLSFLNLRRPQKKNQQEKVTQCVLLFHSAYVPKSQNTFSKISNQSPYSPHSNLP